MTILDKASLRWQCRRGIKEIEVLLVPFFENHFESLSTEQQNAFKQLLDSHDADIFDWFLKRRVPDSECLVKLLDVIQSRLSN